LGKVTATVGAPLADLSEINENLGVLTEAVEAKANNEKDSESTFIVSEVLTMIRGMIYILIEKLQVFIYFKITAHVGIIIGAL
jgi:hypothetical protein